MWRPGKLRKETKARPRHIESGRGPSVGGTLPSESVVSEGYCRVLGAPACGKPPEMQNQEGDQCGWEGSQGRCQKNKGDELMQPNSRRLQFNVIFLTQSVLCRFEEARCSPFPPFSRRHCTPPGWWAPLSLPSPYGKFSIHESTWAFFELEDDRRQRVTYLRRMLNEGLPGLTGIQIGKLFRK